MNPEFLQALWTCGLTVICYLSVLSELVSPRLETLPPEEQDAAIAVYDEFARLNPTCANAFFLRGSALLNKQDFKNALDDFDQAIRLDPESAEAYLGRAQAHQNLDEIDVAFDDYNEAIRLKPGYSMAYVGRGQILLLREERSPNPLDTAVESLEIPCDAERPDNGPSADPSGQVFEPALADFEEAIRLDPMNAQAYLFRGFYWHQRGNLELALEDLNEAIEMDPKTWLNYHFRARLLTSMHKFGDALSDYDRAIELNPDAAQALFERAVILMNRGRPEEALADAERAVCLNPANLALYDLRGVLRFENGDFGAAISDFNELLKRNPHDADLHWKRSVARIMKGDIARGLLDLLVVDERNPKLLPDNILEEIAIQVLRSADEKLSEFTDENNDDLRFAGPFRDRGLAYSALQFSDKALNALDMAIRLDQSSSSAYALRARIWLLERQWDRAIEDFDSAIQLDPNDASFYTDRGLARSEKQQWADACDDFDTAIELDQYQFRAYARRGAARQCLGQLDLAIADYDRVIDSGPFFKRGERRWMTPSARMQASTDAPQSSGNAGDHANSISDVITTAATESGDSVFLNSNDAVTSSSAEFLESAIKPAISIQRTSTVTLNQTQKTTTVSLQSENAFQPRYELRIDPDNALAYRNRAACREVQREWSKAIADYEQLTHLAPKDPMAYRRIAWLKATCPDDACRNGAEALESALRSIELSHPNDVECLLTVAAAYAETDDFDNAVEYQSRAHEALIATCQKEFDERRQHFQSVALDRLIESDETAPAKTDAGEIDAAIRECERTEWKDANLIEVLADAYANSDQFPRAIDCQEKAHQLTLAARENPLLQVLEQYRKGKPHRDQSLIE